jgi:CBS domain-containing protein
MFDNVLVQEWMTSPIITVTPQESIASAHHMMKEYGIRRLPVVESEKLVGIVTLGDVREARPSDATTLTIWELSYLWSKVSVASVMTRQVITINPKASILDAAELMLEHKISGLPVVDERHKLTGILTESDIFRMLVRSGTKAITVRVAPVG